MKKLKSIFRGIHTEYNNNNHNNNPRTRVSHSARSRDEMKPLSLEVCARQGYRLTKPVRSAPGADEIKWTDGWCEGGEIGIMKFVVGKNERIPEKTLIRLRFIHHEPHVERPRRELWTQVEESERICSLNACVHFSYVWLIMTLPQSTFAS